MNFTSLRTISIGLLIPTLSACHLILGIEEAELANDSDSIGLDAIDGLDGLDGVDGPSPGEGIFQLDEGCATEVLPLDSAAIEDCLLRVSCDPLVPPFTLSSCATYGMGTELESTNSCVRGANDCSEIQYCLGRSYYDSSTCSGTSDSWLCVGDVAVDCAGAGDGAAYAVDCASQGSNCAFGQVSTGFLAMGACKPNDTTVEDEINLSTGGCGTLADGFLGCQGNNLFACTEGEIRITDCSYSAGAYTGGTCFDEFNGNAFCTESAPTCETEEYGLGACNGGDLALCTTNGFVIDFSCQAQGLDCYSPEPDESFCLAPGCDAASECEEACLDESTLRICVGGQPVGIDCTSFGFGSCTDAFSDSLGNYSYCVGGETEATPTVPDSGTGSDGLTPEGNDTCATAFNLVCEDPGACDPGTDYSDCLIDAAL